MGADSKPRLYVWRPELTGRLPESIAENREILKPSPTSGGRVSLKQKSEKQEKDRGAAESAPRIPSVIHVRSYFVPSWFTALGVWRKRRMIEGKGMPSLHNWRFITLTIDPKRFPCPLAAYLHASDHMRRFLYACREAGLWKNSCKWCWKMEFQQNGYAHWHLLVSRRSMFTHKQLEQIGDLWALGRTSVERVNEADFRYNFKYAFKPVLMEHEHGESDEFERCAPDWFLDFKTTKLVRVDADEGAVEVEKPFTFARARFWQTSRGFYKTKPKAADVAKAPSSCAVPRTPREVLQRQSRTLQVFSRHANGDYEKASTVVLDISLEKFWGLAGFDIMHGAGVGLGVFSFVIPHHRLTQNTQSKWEIQQLIQSNRLSLRRARHLQAMGQTLKAC